MGRAARVQQWIGYGRISPNLTRAVLVAEDDAFWQHEGVDFVELQESIEVDWARGQLVRGASTITQQLAKNLYLSPSRNPVRKLRELMIARRLEAELKKARILELYLNVIEWGDGIYGVEAAARAYFGTSAACARTERVGAARRRDHQSAAAQSGAADARLVRRQQLILRRMGAVTPPVALASRDAAPPADATATRLEPLGPGSMLPTTRRDRCSRHGVDEAIRAVADGEPARVSQSQPSNLQIFSRLPLSLTFKLVRYSQQLSISSPPDRPAVCVWMPARRVRRVLSAADR